MRCDANVEQNRSAKPSWDRAPRSTKNVNSLKIVEVAVSNEMRRQAAVLAAGGRVRQETRHFHEDGYTSPGRSKETAQDYRSFPEPQKRRRPSASWLSGSHNDSGATVVSVASGRGVGGFQRGHARPGQCRRR